MKQGQKQPNKVLLGIIVVVVLAAITATVVMLSQQQDTGAPANTAESSRNTQESSNRSTSEASEASDGSYKDGSYEAAGSYRTPGGNEEITVKVTLKNSVIATVDLERDPTTREAEEYQGKFVSGYKELVVGKKIDEVELTRVAGSSLTPNGFNQALETIKNDARS